MTHLDDKGEVRTTEMFYLCRSSTTVHPRLSTEGDENRVATFTIMDTQPTVTDVNSTLNDDEEEKKEEKLNIFAPYRTYTNDSKFRTSFQRGTEISF
jgi:hypothetical protein